jgi:hypothetical protein
MWFVVFPGRSGLTRPTWWQRPLHPGYRHVYAVRAEGADATMAFSHCGSVLDAGVIHEPIGAFLRSRMESQAAFALALPAPSAPRRAVLRGPMSCVEVVKGLLGIRAPWIVTPRQLARHLRRAGARPVLSNPAT